MKDSRKVNLALSLLIASTWVGCATAPTPLSSSQDVPGAQGVVKTDQAESGNTKVEVEVKHLAKPQRVESGATTYVVWANPRSGGAPQNLGALRVGPDLNGRLEATTPFRDFQIFITPETSPVVQSPYGTKILWADIVGSA